MGYPHFSWPEIQQWGVASPHSGLKLSSGVERRHIRIPNPTLAFAGSLLKAGRKEVRKEGRKGSHHFQYRPSGFKIVHHFCTLATTFTIFIVFHHTSSFSSSILLVLLTFHHVSISVLITFIVFYHTSINLFIEYLIGLPHVPSCFHLLFYYFHDFS